MSCTLTYAISLTGDCSNDSSGAFSLDILGIAPDYTIQWISPYTTTIPLGSGVTNYSNTGLSGGTYTFNIIDSCSPTNTILPVNVYISTGTCVSITSQTNTLCGLDNGSLTATTTNLYGTGSFGLYEMTSGYITSGVSIVSSYSFGGLSAGTYYVVADDGGGCTGKSETCIIKDSLPLEIGLYVVNDAGCAVNSGSIHITGLTGTPPYTYLWSPGGQTTQSITGLTAGPYTIAVTDGSGCVQSSGVTVTTVPNVGLGAFTVVTPSCFSSDGEVTITITGGTSPYYYSGSNGSVAVSFSSTHTFTGVPAGIFSVQVTDAGLCNFIASVTLLTPGGLSVTSVNVVNSVCNNISGSIGVVIFGGSPPYTYTLIDSLSNSTTVSGSFVTWTFNGLSSGDYTLTISDNGPCVFTQEYTIDNITLFELSVDTIGTTCDSNDGSVTLNITEGGVGPFKFEIDGHFVFTSDLTYTFTNLSSGNYTATVTDSNGCVQILPFTIDNSSTLDFVLAGTDSTNGSNGTISTFITNGEPPFILDWSLNVNGQTGLNVNTLSAGTYTLTVTDSNGCVQTRDIIISGFNLLSSYQTYNICDGDFMNTGQTIRKGPQQMLTEGFYDLTSGDTNCILNQTIFYAEVTVNGDTQIQSFYTGSTLTEFPLDSLFYDVVKEILISYGGIGEVLIDYLNNMIVINTDCNSDISLIDGDVKISLKISYDIACQICGPTPTPTPTPLPCYAITILDTIVVEDAPLSAVYVPTNGYLYVNNSDSSSVSVIDVITNSVITTINVGLNNDGLIQYNPDNGYIYVPNRSSNTVSVIDTVTNTVIGLINTGHLGYGSLYVTGVNKLYITDNLSVFLRVIDTTTNNVLTSVTLTGAAYVNPNGLTYDPINGYVYVSITNFDVVDVVDPVTDTVVLSIPVGNEPSQILYSSINNYVYVVNYLDDTVSKINTTTNAVVSIIPVGFNPVSIIETPLYIYVTNTGDDTITVIDINTDATITIPATGTPSNSTYNPSNGYLYVNQEGGVDSVLIIDTITNTVVSTITLSSFTTFGIYTPSNNNIYVNEVSKSFPFEDNMIELGCLLPTPTPTPTLTPTPT